MKNFMDEELLKELGLEPMEIAWHLKFLMRFWPSLFMKIMASKMGIMRPTFDKVDKLQDAFGDVESVDFFASNSGSRGFVLVLDRKIALYFYQDGDHFIYDGFEMGEYNKGDVTILDNIQK